MPDILLGELVVAYLAHVDVYYRGSREAHNIRLALRPACALHAELPAVEFGPAKLKAARQSMVDEGLARNTINARVRKLRAMFRWAVEEELLPATIPAALASVKALMPGRGGVETAPREPVSWDLVERTLPSLTPMFRSAVLFLYWTGCRVGECFALTPAMIDRTSDPWKATLAIHKTHHRTGRPRIIRIGPRARAALEPWLRPSKAHTPIFSPLLADDRQERRQGKRKPGKAYCRSSLSQTLRRACERAGVPVWTLARLRHTAGTRFREELGIDVASVLLGHAKPDTTAIYSSKATKHADEAAKKAG